MSTMQTPTPLAFPTKEFSIFFTSIFMQKRIWVLVDLSIFLSKMQNSSILSKAKNILGHKQDNNKKNYIAYWGSFDKGINIMNIDLDRL